MLRLSSLCLLSLVLNSLLGISLQDNIEQMSEASYLVGNRVYRGASNAPTRGTVDPMGYIERELNKGMSTFPLGAAVKNNWQRRSGLAGAALNRLQGNSGGSAIQGPQHGQTLGSALQPPQTPGQTALQNGSTGILSRPPIGSISGGPVQFNPGGGGVAGGPPKLGVATGAMPGASGTGQPGDTSLPFDAQFGQDSANAAWQHDNFMAQIQAMKDQLENQYAQGSRDLNIQHPMLLRQLLGNYAGRGMAHSSGYADQYGNVEQQFQNAMNDLNMQHTTGAADLLNQQNTYEAGYQQFLDALRTAAAQRLSDQAGGLGLGGDATTGNGGGLFTGNPPIIPISGPNGAPTGSPTRAWTPSTTQNKQTNLFHPPSLSIRPVRQ